MIEEEPAAAEPGKGEPQTTLQTIAAIGVMLILAVGVLGALYLVVDETSGEAEPTPAPPHLGADVTPARTLTPQPRQTINHGETPRPTQDSLRPTPREQPPHQGTALCGGPGNRPDGLSIETLVEGSGEAPVIGDTVSVEYSGWVNETNALFDSTYFPGSTAYTYTVGSGVIAGFDAGVVLTKRGGTSLICLPPELAYGAEGPSGIPPNAAVIFEITVLP